MDALGQVMATRTMLMRDDEGRPLSEAKAGTARMCGAAFELRTCPYPGSRHHHARPMNLSALRQVSAHWRDLLGALGHLHGLHRHGGGSSPPRLADVWRIGHMTNAIADFAFMRSWQPFDDGELPATIGALYKIMLGVTSTAYKAWSDGAVRFATPVAADFILDYAERHGQLIGPDQVCGGSETMIRELLGVVMGGGPPHAGGPVAATVIGDEARFRRFCDATAALRLLRFVVERLDAALRWHMVSDVGSGLTEPARRAFAGGDPAVPPLRFAALAPDAQLDELDDLVAELGAARYLGAELAAGARALRCGWLCAPEPGPAVGDAVVAASAAARALPGAGRDRLARCLARYLEIERVAAALVRRLKASIAEALGIDLAAPLARERGLVEFVPARAGRPSMRAALRDAFDITLAAPDGEVTVVCGGLRFALAPEPAWLTPP